MPRRRRLGFVAAFAVAIAFGAAPCGEPVCDRVVAVGDLHGGFESFLRILRETGLVGDDGSWADPRACLIQLGDVADRGGRPRMIYDLLMELERQAPGRVEMLLGNHEVMNLVGDLRYTNRVEFEEFAVEETAGERAAGFEAYRRSDLATGDLVADLREFDARYPPGWFAHRREFSPEGRYGAWLLSRPAMKVVDGTLYVHGGIDEAIAGLGVDRVNARVLEDVREYLALRKRLVEAGALGALASFSESFDAASAKLAEAARSGGGGPPWEEEALRFLGLASGLPFDPAGPLWNRTLAKEDDAVLLETLPNALARLGVRRVVVGHTVQRDGRIRARADRRVYLADTGAGPAYGGHPSALEVHWTGRIEAVYPGSRELLDSCSLSDEEAERFLAEGIVIATHEIGSGVTAPKHEVLELDGRTLCAAFKTVHIHETRPIRMERSGLTFEFTDSYRNERSAYLLDRMLGIGMVAPSRIRILDGVEGALVAWVSDAVCGREISDLDLSPAEALALSRQREVMAVFDALIANVDRNLGNQLVTPHDRKLHLIDHSRSFRLDRKLSKEFRSAPSSLPRALLDRLVGLDESGLLDLLDGLVTREQVKALLARRNAIVTKVEADRRKYGDALVFHELAPPLDPP